MIKNKNGDPIFINKDNTKRIRFDVHNSHGELPHGHVEYFSGTRWKDDTTIHRITLKDASELINSNPPKLDK
jgi:hypothetical protein